jgi:hypothetical protein
VSNCFINPYPVGNVANVNTTSGINHFAVSYTNSSRIAGYLNGTKIFYAPYNPAIQINIDSFVLKSPNVIEAAFYVNAGNVYPASTGVVVVTVAIGCNGIGCGTILFTPVLAGYTFPAFT